MLANVITKGVLRDIFTNLSTNFLLIMRNYFPCDPHDCETNSLILIKSKKDLRWRFEDNQCIENKDICVKDRISKFNGLTCRLSRQIAECVCNINEPVNLPQLDVSVLFIEGCFQLYLEHKTLLASTPLVALHIHGVELLFIKGVSQSLRTIILCNSRILIHQNAFYGSQIDRLEINSSSINVIERASFNDGFIKKILIHDSEIMDSQSGAFRNFTVNSFIAERTKIYNSIDIWQHFSYISIMESYIACPMPLLNVSSLCLKKNIIECECVEGDLDAKSNCGDGSSICNERKSPISPYECSIPRLCESAGPHSQDRYLIRIVLIFLYYGSL